MWGKLWDPNLKRYKSEMWVQWGLETGALLWTHFIFVWLGIPRTSLLWYKWTSNWCCINISKFVYSSAFLAVLFSVFVTFYTTISVALKYYPSSITSLFLSTGLSNIFFVVPSSEPSMNPIIMPSVFPSSVLSVEPFFLQILVPSCPAWQTCRKTV